MNMNNRHLIWGMGVTGMSVARFLHARKQPFVAVDNCLPTMIEPTDTLVISPGIPVSHAPDCAEVIGDIELFAREMQQRPHQKVVGITGSNGKSTVTDLVTTMLQNAGIKAQMGGNIGIPALDLLEDDSTEVFVLELSSFQLETTASLDCTVGCVLNISPDHLDRYPDVDAYVAAKKRLIQQSRAVALWGDDPVLQQWALPSGVARLAFGFDTADHVRDMALQGRHHRLNAAAAMTICRQLGVSEHSILDTLRQYTGLPHRTVLVRELHGVRWINDSKGTNPGATIAALQGLSDGKNIVLLAGGQAKGADFSELGAVAQNTVKHTIVFGEDAELLAAVMPRVMRADTLEHAIQQAKQATRPGDVILFSPACASFDMFNNYIHRGEVFTALVEDVQ
jgi:UDP-N-acetylmuramoylalanine--D-glutamate ligase